MMNNIILEWSIITKNQAYYEDEYNPNEFYVCFAIIVEKGIQVVMLAKVMMNFFIED